MRAALLGLHGPSSVLIEWTGKCASDLTIDHPYFLLTEERFTLARVMLALSLFAFFVRLMYIFSFSIVLGPKLIMINRMVDSNLFKLTTYSGRKRSSSIPPVACCNSRWLWRLIVCDILPKWVLY